MGLRFGCLLAVSLFGPAASANGQPSHPGAPLHVTRTATPIRVDGDLSDEGWRTATRVDTWYETMPGDNGEPSVNSVGYLAYDHRFFYVAFEFEDPNPSAIRAPLGDRDSIRGSRMDFGGVLLDPLNTGRTAYEFYVSPRNVQYDSVTDDASGQNAAPDFFWDSAARITGRGWTLEIRIPFSTLRYKSGDPQRWGIMLVRNYPRQHWYQFWSMPLPRNNNCQVCYENPLTGLENLPRGGHVTAAPYVSASDTSSRAGGVPGAPLAGEGIKPHGGIDVKFTPNATSAVDLTVKPDFSQVESDTAQISANERFALSFPEKRPFFLESVDLLQMPIQAVYTRTITAPVWGGRLTGRAGGIRYTALVTEDAGGGSVVLPGPNGSSTASQDFASRVFIGRAKREMGRSYVGTLVAAREAVDGGAHNRVAGPDFQWRPSAADVVTGQWLFSGTQTPVRPDLTSRWSGQGLTGSALQSSWNHMTRHLDWQVKYSDVDSDFRAETGFVPQVGYRQGYAQAGWQIYPTGFVSRARTFLNVDYQAERSGAVIARGIDAGLGLVTRFSGSLQFRYIDNHTRAVSLLIGRRQFGYNARFSPSRHFSLVTINGTVGQDIDFANARAASGVTVNANAIVQSTDHFALDLVSNTRWLNVANPAGGAARLLTQSVSRVKGTYTFTSRLFVRVIGQYVSTSRDKSLFVSRVGPRAGTFSGSALFAYKLNWQSVMFVGYGDDRELSDARRLEKVSRQFFVKLSYAFQR
jgi:hypothetical protein